MEASRLFEYSGPDQALMEWGGWMKLLVLFIVWLNVLIAPDGLATQLTVSAFAIAIASLAAKMLCAALLIVGVELGSCKNPHPASTRVSRRHFRALVPGGRDVQPGRSWHSQRRFSPRSSSSPRLNLLIARQVRGAITGYAAQSILLGGLAVAMFAGSRLPHLLALELLTIGIKGFGVPAVVQVPRFSGSPTGGARSPIQVGSPDSFARRRRGSRCVGLVAARAFRFSFCCSRARPGHRGDFARPVVHHGRGTARCCRMGGPPRRGERSAARRVGGQSGVELAHRVCAGPGRHHRCCGDEGFIIARMHETVASTDTS